MGNVTSLLALGIRELPQPHAIKPQQCRSLFKNWLGQNIPDELNPAGPSQYFTVWFEWEDRLLGDEELMSLVATRIKAGRGVIGPERLHHDIRYCMSIRVPPHYNASDRSIAHNASKIAEWWKSEMIHAGVILDRPYLFRERNIPSCSVVPACSQKVPASARAVKQNPTHSFVRHDPELSIPGGFLGSQE